MTEGFGILESTGRFINIAGDYSKAHDHAVRHFASINIVGTRLADIRDPYQHIIRRMLEPEFISIFDVYRIWYYHGQFWISTSMVTP